jgi:hypothetical protein
MASTTPASSGSSFDLSTRQKRSTATAEETVATEGSMGLAFSSAMIASSGDRLSGIKDGSSRLVKVSSA